MWLHGFIVETDHFQSDKPCSLEIVHREIEDNLPDHHLLTVLKIHHYGFSHFLVRFQSPSFNNQVFK